ncbi:thermosome subunit gamma [Rhynchospora pubera]|uniref:Thermosome subunit gamma n=1 Tax=Rhynchospora pubera TaxID=906938 RepID=A0AAV8FWW2_9POAL|nr:thermosome subunit gamma [Rhynchospora pubera]
MAMQQPSWSFPLCSTRRGSLLSVSIPILRYYEILQQRLDNYGCVIYEGVVEKECTQNSSLNKITFSWDLQSIRDYYRQEAHRLSLVQQADYLKSRPSWKHGDLDRGTMLYLEKEREKLVAICRTPLHDLMLTSPQHSGSLPWPVTTAFLLPFITYLACSCDDPVLGSLDMLENFLNVGRFSQSPKFWEAWRIARSHGEHENTGLGKDSVIIGERNKVAIKVLNDAIKKGEHSIAILYGAGHMPDFHKRLTDEFDLVPTSMNWITAWSVEDGPKSKYIQPFLNNFPSEGGTLILASLIFATLIVEILSWLVTCLTCIRLAVFLFSLFT